MKSSFRLTLALTCLVTLTNHLCADQVDDYVKQQMQKQHIPGLSLAIVKNGRIIKAKGYGLANVELNVPATKDTVYEIGSITKVFTATVVMMLVNDGKIGLDDKITNYLSDLPSAWSNITVMHLLSHRSGITNDYVDREFPEEFPARRQPLSAKQMIQSVADSPLAFDPGTQTAYSNTGYYLLGMLIEKVSGKSYAAFMKERVFVPLNMSSTCVNDLKVIVTNRANGYFYGTDLRNNEYCDTSWLFSAGAIVSSVTDLIRWDAALYTEKLLPKARFEQMWATGGERHPLGWGVFVSGRYGRGLDHGGRTPGFSAGSEHWIDQRLAIIFLANMDGIPSLDICDGIANFYLPGIQKEKQSQ